MDARLYAGAISMFFPIYREIETLLVKTPHPSLKAYAKVLPQLARAGAFEEDLRYFLGPGWEAAIDEDMRSPSSPVGLYLEHLRELAKLDPELLLIYTYHMHMALLSGGQILRRLVTSALALPKGDGGTAIYEFGRPAPELKEEVRATIDRVLDSKSMGEARMAVLEEESIRLFVMNNEVVGSFRIEGRHLLRGLLRYYRVILLTLLVLIVCVALVFKLVRK